MYAVWMVWIFGFLLSVFVVFLLLLCSCWGKIYKNVLFDNQHFVIILKRKMKKNLAGMKKSCTFALDFKRRDHAQVVELVDTLL